MRRREFIAGLGSAAAWLVATLTPDVVMANSATVTPLLAGDSHLSCRHEWTGGDV